MLFLALYVLHIKRLNSQFSVVFNCSSLYVLHLVAGHFCLPRKNRMLRCTFIRCSPAAAERPIFPTKSILSLGNHTSAATDGVVLTRAVLGHR